MRSRLSPYGCFTYCTLSRVCALYVIESKQPELVHYNHPDCFEAPVVGATILTRPPAHASPVPKGRSFGSPASPLMCFPGESSTTDPDKLSPSVTSRQIFADVSPISLSPLSPTTTHSSPRESTLHTRSPASAASSPSKRKSDASELFTEVIHFKLDLSQMRRGHFEPGDSIGIRCPNDMCAFYLMINNYGDCNICNDYSCFDAKVVQLVLFTCLADCEWSRKHVLACRTDNVERARVHFLNEFFFMCTASPERF